VGYKVLIFGRQPFGNNSIIELVLVQTLRYLLFDRIEILLAQANIKLLLGIDILKFDRFSSRRVWFFKRDGRFGRVDLVDIGASAGSSHSIFFKF
jgi:hypothetical protein